MQSTTYRLNSIHIEDFKRLKNVNLDLSGAVTIIAGKNGQGKSSVLDALATAIGGKKLAPKVPIRKGSNYSEIILVVDSPQGQINVRRSFTKDGGFNVELTSADGFKAKSPQALLDSWLSAGALDPIEFTRLKPKEQADSLKRVAGLNFELIDEKRKSAYDDRTFENRICTDLKAKFQGLSRVPDDTPDEEINIVEVSARLNRARENNVEIERTRVQIDLCEEESQSLRKRIAELTSELDARTNQLSMLKAKTAPLSRIEEKPLEDALANAEAINQNVRQKKAIAEARDEWKKANANSETLSKIIDECDAEKARLIASAKFPVEGLGFGEDGLTFNGLPFEQASSAEQLRVSVPMAFAQNSALKFAIIRDGSLLDEDSLKLVAELTAEAGGQLIIEKVGSVDDDFTVILEDGEAITKAESDARKKKVSA